MDVQLTYDGQAFDLSLSKNDLTLDPGLDSAIAISLFSDAQISKDELDQNETDRRGWWGDEFSDDTIGSRLWTLRRSKQTDETLKRAREYALEALDWLTDSGVADTVEVQAEWLSVGFLGLAIQVTRPTGLESYKYKTAWTAQAAL